MTRTVEFLDPARKLVAETVQWLCGNERFAGRVRTREGARTLEHVMVIVPTAQSGRNLRLALAQEAARRGWCGILPPRVACGNALLVPKDVRIATEAEELAALAEILLTCEVAQFAHLFPGVEAKGTDWALGMAKMILDVEGILGELAFLMGEVKSAMDAERWRDLARLEEMLIRALEAKGVTPRFMARRQAVAAGCREAGIEEIVLPAAVDISEAFVDYLSHSAVAVSVLLHATEDERTKFDEWGRPCCNFTATLDPAVVEAAPNAVLEADAIAKRFKAVAKDEAYPALAVCDAEMYPELEGAFQNCFAEDELVLRNPAQTPLARSELGRLLETIMTLAAHGDYETFSTFVRMGDVARWARETLGVSAADVARFVGALDAVQNEHLPRTIDEVIAGARARAQSAHREAERADAAGLVRLAEEIKKELAAPFAFLKKLFASLTLDEKIPGDRELIAAAEVVRQMRADCASAIVPPQFRPGLFALLLKHAAYMLEPMAEHLLVTTGWLEVAWSPEDELVFAGFNEGCVPENVVGHPFVPDSLRTELGLLNNARRGFRDAFIFREALACRPPHAVAVYLHQIASDKNVMKPSRLIFNGVTDAELPVLARRLYAVTKGNEGVPPKGLPEAWRLKLPIPPKGLAWRPSISVSQLDQYLSCPFAFYLQETFGERAADDLQELDELAFGTLCHAALEAFAKDGPKDSTDAAEIGAFLADSVRRQLRAFGDPLPAIIALQGEAAIVRLRAFAERQAERRRAGWRIVRAEQSLKCRFGDCPTVLNGKIDRIDRHEETGELAIIDYKTWNRAADKSESIQLPAYRALVQASGLFNAQEAAQARALYCILAERPEDVQFDDAHAYREGTQGETEARVRALLTNLARGIFYPPGKDSAWANSYGGLVWQSPEEGIDSKWLADQTKRLEALV